MSTAAIKNMTARNTILLEPLRIIPPLVASIVDGHQVGVIVPVEELLAVQAQKWQVLATPPLYALANPIHDPPHQLISAGKSCWKMAPMSSCWIALVLTNVTEIYCKKT